jgi:two-component system chemotaxis response regulator CheY
MTNLSLGDLRVLLVEPSTMQAELTRRMLARLGVRHARHCGRADEALAALRASPADVVMSSLYLPDMTGAELVAKLRRDAALEWTPFILVSSETRPQALDPIRQSGACCIVAKPFTEAQLSRAICAAVDQLSPPPRFETDEVDNLRVLLVDDSLFSRRHLRHLLEEMGIRKIIEAQDGKEAIACLTETMVDLVLTDYNMPEMDGRALVEYIRTQSWQTAVPILMVTSEQDQGRLAAVEKAGVSAICDKPFEADSIRQIIAQALNA